MQIARHNSLNRSFSKIFRAAFVAVALGAGLTAQAGIKSDRLLARIINHTPAPELVADGLQMQAAEKHAAARAGATAFYGVGSSMEPLYAPKTAIVVEPIAYDDIKKGMTLVYRKANGGLVAHSVIDEDRRGYVVQGVNNDEPDAVSVNERNLVGVITAAFAGCAVVRNSSPSGSRTRRRSAGRTPSALFSRVWPWPRDDGLSGAAGAA
jgi:signal peptidase I